MAVTVALAGDTMLGRRVAERLAADPGHALLAPDLVAIAREADLFIVNLECCISDRGERVRDPAEGFFFRAPPVAAERLAQMGVTCVTLANNHVLDFGPDAFQDTLAHLRSAGVAAVGAGADDAAARTPGSSRRPITRPITPQLPTGRESRSPTSTTASRTGCASAPRPAPTPTW
jgi:poly-gamma-glutamate capsule biosynthesis protein CapA/YwtB (metallophosphatase superfamily)